MTTTAEIIGKIEEATTAFDKDRARDAVDELVAHVDRLGAPLPEGDARAALGMLQRKRFFGLAALAAEAIIRNGQIAPRVRRYFAQALIDDKKLSAAVTTLEKLVADTGDDPAENAEARGLLGRALKQQYVNGVARGEADPELLRGALEAYRVVYGKDERNRWHGINTVALMRRAERDGVPLDTAATVAERLLRDVRNLGAEANAWDLATAVEACVALGDREEAIRWASGYAAHPGADAFELGSTVRQLEEVWSLDSADALGGPVLAILRNGLLQRENGYVELTPREAREEGLRLEKVFGAEKYVSLYWYRNGLARTRFVARIRNLSGQTLGTGFLVWGRTLADRLGDDWYLITNEHVVSPDVPNRYPDALYPEQAKISFEVLAGEPGVAKQEYSVRDVVSISLFEECDYTLVSLDKPVAGVERGHAYQIAPKMPKKVSQDRVFVIGHPFGKELSLSIHDNLLLEFDDRLLRYRTPTDPGSSGSPVFDADWNLVGLHHAGHDKLKRLDGSGATIAANEGIWIDAIRERLAKA